MPRHSHSGAGTRQADLDRLGEGQDPRKLQGHWVLARAGKRVLRPGGLELTRRMLDALAIGPQDRVVEFAPGLGVTARMVLGKRPKVYWGIEREPAAAERLRRQFQEANAQIVLSRAEESGLPRGCATVVYSEALLSMQNWQEKSRIVAEARRLLDVDGSEHGVQARYGIHELCLVPGDLSDAMRNEIQAAMSQEIHVGVQPLSRNRWIKLLEQNGLKVAWSGEAPMRLLKPRRLIEDEGWLGFLRIVFRGAADPMLRERLFAMQRLFRKYEDYLGAISLVARPYNIERLGSPDRAASRQTT